MGGNLPPAGILDTLVHSLIMVSSKAQEVNLHCTYIARSLESNSHNTQRRSLEQVVSCGLFMLLRICPLFMRPALNWL